MDELTFFEIHLDGASFEAKAPFSGAESPDDVDADATGGILPGLRGDDEDEPAAGDAEGDGSGPLGAVLAVVALVVLVVVLRRLVGGEPEPVPE